MILGSWVESVLQEGYGKARAYSCRSCREFWPILPRLAHVSALLQAHIACFWCQVRSSSSQIGDDP